MKRPSRLALRIYVVVLLQFLVVAAALEITRRARSLPPFGDKIARYAAVDIAAVYDDRPALDAQVRRIATTLVWTVDVRDASGNVVCHGAPPPEEAAHSTKRGHGRVAIPLSGGRAATLEYEIHPPGPSPNMSTPSALALILLVVGAFSFMTARSLTTPLGRLASAARAFGGGQLDARARMDRADEIGEVARAFDDMADRVARLLLAERDLLANVSHELRTPLARIRVALDLANEAEAHKAMESFGEIAEDLAELEQIVDGVLAAARLAHGGDASAMPVRKERIASAVLLEKSVAKFRGLHPDRELAADIEGELPDLVGDAVLVRRVVDNLLDNARKYSKGAIEVSAKRDDGMILIEVRDHGVGIAPEDLERVFEPFFRADRSRTRATGGLGLGLALARGVVEAHGGTIDFSSEVGDGTTARVRLPAAG